MFKQLNWQTQCLTLLFLKVQVLCATYYFSLSFFLKQNKIRGDILQLICLSHAKNKENLREKKF